ncbi:MAG TPA: family 20 glycosylhydrolase [Flavisolibacter sp.]|jgi:hexosaminidase
MRILLLIITFFLINFCRGQKVDIIPQPVSVQKGGGSFTLSSNTVIAVRDEGDRKAAEFLNAYLQEVYGFKLDIDKQEGKNYIRLYTRKFIKAPDKDAYSLYVSGEGVNIEGDTYAGTFHGIQSLIQLLPPTDVRGLMKRADGKSVVTLAVPSVAIQDYPRFKYRGMHLDVARHMFPVSFIKKYIDYLALHKMNYFHWHLTDDQGWRIEIKKYPELMTTGAYRNGTIIGRFPGKGNDNTRYGGFYTQEEVREIVRYAADRHITVMPEIEMPGHASAAIAAYPWLSCFPNKPTVITRNTPATGGNQGIKRVQETWGVFEDVFCAGNDSTFMFLEGVMEEVLALFPSRYIHVGGDECPKAHWKICPKCQGRIKEEGLKDEHQLQSYFIQRMEKYLNSRDRVLVGWDEILEGGLAPNAVVMSWRGEAGGITAARQKHDVIMTPQKPVYFDHTQTRTEDSVTIGGYNPLEAVYAYDPVPAELKPEEAKYIMGAQANLWTEYIKYPSRVEYMVFPRMSALSEVLWTPKEKKNWQDFERRLPVQLKRYELWRAHYSNAYLGLAASVTPSPNNTGVLWKISTQHKTARITVQRGPSAPATAYTKPLAVTASGTYQAQLVYNGSTISSMQQKFDVNKATGKKITLKSAPSPTYPGDGAFTLVNGIVNETGLDNPKDFLGFNGSDMEAVIDLGKPQKINSARLYFLRLPDSWIYRPSSVRYYTSSDGKNFESVISASNGAITERYHELSFSPRTARYVKVVAKNHGSIPQGNEGAGKDSWLFVDEIQVK